MSAFEELLLAVEREKAERKKKYGRHRCKWQKSATESQLMKMADGSYLRIVRGRFYRCAKCWDMKVKAVK